MGADSDHIPLLCSAHPKYSPGQIGRLYKSVTARELLKSVPQLKKDLWGGYYVTDGYYVATVGDHGNWTRVTAYVAGSGGQSGPDQLRLFDL